MTPLEHIMGLMDPGYPEPIRHSMAQGILDKHAQDLAELQRRHFGVGDAPVKAHCDPDCDFCQGVTSAADLIDPRTAATAASIETAS